MQLIPNSSVPINIIFEDEFIIVLDKPSGRPVYPAKVIPAKAGIQFISLDPRVRGDDILKIITTKWPKAEPVHRLDNDTSGCLLVAKTAEAYKKLRRQFGENKILKKYTALVLGETPAEGIIETPITHDPKNKKRMNVAPKHGRPRTSRNLAQPGSLDSRLRGNDRQQVAFTSYKLLKKYLGGQYSLLEVTIETGVRHQIRVHLASIGHPITGDRLYQNARQHARDKTNLSRQFLHATKIGFNHPKDGRWVEYSSPLPEDLRNVLTKLEGEYR